MRVEEILERLETGVRERFAQSERVLSFSEYLADFCERPKVHLRTAPQYVLDMLDSFGTREESRIGQEGVRYQVFDREGRSGVMLAGQEGVQHELYQHLKAFAKQGTAHRMLLLHGPNGSGKTTIVECLFEGLERYSRSDDGALFTFNWIFTEQEEGLERIGFDKEAASTSDLDSFAHLEEKDISARISCELHDHPIFLIPKRSRREVIDEAVASCRDQMRPRFVYDYYLDGDLSEKAKKIYNALLVAYQGDWRKLLRHVQVERFFISKRYRVGAVTIEPQGNVDATARPIQHESAWNIPSILRNLSLYEPLGDIVDANRGILEYGDFLKRPIEANKYLLTTCERGTANLGSAMAYLDLVIVGTTNEKQLNVFKRSPDFSSFKGRIELLAVPYLLRFSTEAQLYDERMETFVRERHVAPHAAKVAALWAVLTRLRRPNPKNYRRPLSSIVGKLTPLEKARLYDSGETPSRLNEEERKLSRSSILEIRREFVEDEAEFEGIFGAEYEGRRGASPREMMSILARAANMREYRCLTPIAIFAALEELMRDTSVYDFLRIPTDGDYHNVQKFLDDVREEYIRWVNDEVYDSISLVDEGEYGRFFLEYFRQVKAYHTGESVYNATTNTYEPPNEELMASVEKLLQNVGSKDDFRSNIITRIAAWSLDHPQVEIRYEELFPEIYAALRDNFYKERNRILTLIEQDILKYGTDEFDLLSEPDKEQVIAALKTMKSKYSYCESCARDVIAFVLRHRLEERKGS